MQDYRDRERIVDAKGLALSGAGKQLEELTRSLVEARQKRAEAESAYSMVQQIRAGRGAGELRQRFPPSCAIRSCRS